MVVTWAAVVGCSGRDILDALVGLDGSEWRVWRGKESVMKMAQQNGLEEFVDLAYLTQYFGCWLYV